MIVSAEQLRIRAGGRLWSPEQTQDAERVLEEVEGEIADLLGAPISPGAARVEQAPILAAGLVCPRWPVHTVTSIGGDVVDQDHPLDPVWRLEEGYLQHTAPATLASPVTGLPPVGSAYAFVIGTVELGYLPGWGDIPSIRSMITKVALARVINSHGDTMLARDLQAEVPPAVREPDPDTIRRKLGRWRWLQVTR